MKRASLFGLFAAFTLSACAPSPTRVPSLGPKQCGANPPTTVADAHDAREARVEALLADAIAKQHLVGVTAAYGTTRGLAWSRGYGLADVENGVAATKDTVYRFASVSKTITSVAAMQLVESGKLDLDAPIQRAVPSFPVKPWPITAREILTHTSGIRHYKDGEPETLTHYPTLEAGLARFANEPLLYQPGHGYVYSSYAFNLLGRAVEGASGEGFVSYVRAHIFEPAGMTATRDDDLFAIIPHRTQGYTRADESDAGARGDGDERALHNSELADTSYKIPSGGLCGTAEDLVRFALAIASHRILRAETVAAMFTLQTVGDPPKPHPDGYGLGWMLEDLDHHRVAFHTGAQPRTASIVYLLPDDGVAVAIVSNLEGARLHALAKDIARAVVAPEHQVGD